MSQPPRAPAASAARGDKCRGAQLSARRGDYPLFAGGLRHRLESEGEIPRRLEPLLGVLLETVARDAVEARRDLASGSRELRRLRVQDGRHRVGGRRPGERSPARQHLVQHRPQTEDVGAMIDGQPSHLLGRHVSHRAHHGARLRVAGDRRGAGLFSRSGPPDVLRQAEIEDLDLAVPGDEEILGLQVPVDDAPLMGGPETSGDLLRVVRGLPLGDRTRCQHLAQRACLPEAP